MAARLNTPADFVLLTANTAKAPQEGLLPPSVFENPVPKPTITSSGSQNDPWEELSKATTQILELKSQIQKLREPRNVTVTAQEVNSDEYITQPIKAQVEVCHQQSENPEILSRFKDVTSISLSHMDGIIQRQAADIVQVQQKLAQNESEHQKHEACMQSERMLLDASHKQEVSSLKAEIQNLEERHLHEVKQIQAEAEEMKASKSETIKNLEETLRGLQETSQREIDHLKSQLNASEEKSAQVSEKYQRNQRKDSDEISDLKQEVSQLKTYLAEAENTHKSSDTWRREITNFKSKLQIKDEEIQNLHQNMELAKVRQEAQNRMLSLQELQLSQMQDESLDKKRGALLTRWRKKVYELMVQVKSAEISNAHQEHNWKIKIQTIESKLAEGQSEIQLRLAEIEEKEAQLKMAQHQIKNLNVELTRAQDMALNLDRLSGDQWDHVDQLAQAAKGIYSKYEVTLKMQGKVESTLKSYEKRINFATGRVYMLQSQFARKEALLKLRYEEPTRQHEDSQAEPSEVEALKAELSRLTQERDVLSRQLQQDSELLEYKVKQAKDNVESQIQELEDTIRRQSDQLSEKNKIIDDLQEEFATNMSALNDNQNELKKLKAEQKQMRCQIEKELSHTLESERNRVVEQFAEMERKMNEARREQTKALVALRQLERSATRNKEQTSEQICEMEKSYKEALAKEEQRRRNLEKDRNLLMATLRQEGLINQYKSKRMDPAVLDLAMEEPEQGDSDPATSTWKRDVSETDSEPLHDVIDDLKTLTANVIEEDEPFESN